MKELIEKIKKEKGVKTVEMIDGKAVVTFEPAKWAVECKTKEQWDFIRDRVVLLIKWTKPSCIDIKNGGVAPKDWFLKNNYNVISFSQYREDHNLKSEWHEYLIDEAKKRYPVGTKIKNAYHPDVNTNVRTVIGDYRVVNNEIDVSVKETGAKINLFYSRTWAEIIPNEVELVKGGIYDYLGDRTIRFKRKHKTRGMDTYSQLTRDGIFYKYSEDVGYHDDYKNLKPATDKQKRKLIKSEVKNGYFHELNKDK